MTTPPPTPAPSQEDRELALALIEAANGDDVDCQWMLPIIAAHCARLEEALRDRIAQLEGEKVNSEFWLYHEKQTNSELEADYLEIWRAIKEPDKTVKASALAMKAKLTASESEVAGLRAALEWNGGLPPVPEGKEGRFLVSSSGVIHLLLYCNKFWAPCSDDCEPPENAPSNDDGDICWTGWCEESCQQCDTFWTFADKVDGWMPLPTALRPAHTQPKCT
jgi:hypothetical protein